MSLEKTQLSPHPFSLEIYEQKSDGAKEEKKEFLSITKKILEQKNATSSQARVTFATSNFEGVYSKISSEAITATDPTKSSTSSSRPNLIRTQSSMYLHDSNSTDCSKSPNTIAAHRLYIKTLEEWNLVENLNYFKNRPVKAIIIDLHCVKTLEEWNSIKNIDSLIQNLVQQFKARGYEKLTVNMTINSLRLAILFELHGFKYKESQNNKNYSVFSQTFCESPNNPTKEISSSTPLELKRKKNVEDSISSSPKKQKTEQITEEKQLLINPSDQ